MNKMILEIIITNKMVLNIIKIEKIQIKDNEWIDFEYQFMS